MAILEKEVLVGITGSNYSYYEKSEYQIPRYKDNQGRFKIKKGTKIYVQVKDLPKNSNIKVTKICDECFKHNKQTYQSVIQKRSYGKDICKICASKINGSKRKDNIKYHKSLEYYAKTNDRVHLLKEFSEKNKNTTSKIAPFTKDVYIWNCSNCKSEYETSVGSRVNMNSGCPYCSGQKVNHTNCLATTNPELIKEWHPIKNGNVNPHGVTKGTTKKAWWICPSCNSEYESAIYSRSSLGTGCPYCNHSKVNHTNCLRTTHPDLSLEWDYLKNGDLTPENISKGSEKDIWWICPDCNSSYMSNVYNRTCSNNSCPYCSGKKINETNCLAKTHPDMTKEWHYTKNGNLTPNSITHGSSKRVWWKCEKGHEWEVQVNSRTSDGTRCPKCSELDTESKGESNVRIYLDKNKIKYNTQVKFDRCFNIRKLPFDFMVNDKIMIEYDGKQHFQSFEHFGGFEKFEQNKKNDKIKNQYCIENGIPLIRIPYWEFNNIAYILENILKHFNLIAADNTYNKEIVLKYLVDEHWDHEYYLTLNIK